MGPRERVVAFAIARRRPVPEQRESSWRQQQGRCYGVCDSSTCVSPRSCQRPPTSHRPGQDSRALPAGADGSPPQVLIVGGATSSCKHHL